MMAVTAIIFTVAYITAQFNSVAYSPRVALMFVRDPILYHSFGLFSSTFIFSLFTLAWVDREASEMVPIFSMAIVAILLVGSMFAFSRLVRGVNDLQVTNTLQTIGNHGRAVLSATFSHLGNAADSNAKDRPRIVTFCISPSPRSCDTPVRPDQSPSSMSTHCSNSAERRRPHRTQLRRRR
jgi:uncharacterized membrane protein